MRVLDFFTLMSADHPVLLATHSDRLLDGLERPADQIKVCERDPKDNQTRLRALDPEALRQWLDEYRGVGDVRSAGYLPNLLRQANGSDIAPANVELSQRNMESVLIALRSIDSSLVSPEAWGAAIDGKALAVRDQILNNAATPDPSRRPVRDSLRKDLTSFNRLVKRVERALALPPWGQI